MNIVPIKPPGRKSQNAAFGKPVPECWGQPLPGEENTIPKLVYEASVRLVEAGLSVIPIEAYEGTKSPDNLRLPHPHDPVDGKAKPSRSIYKIRRPYADELRLWYERNGPCGLAVIGGAVS